MTAVLSRQFLAVFALWLPVIIDLLRHQVHSHCVSMVNLFFLQHVVSVIDKYRVKAVRDLHLLGIL